MGKVRTVARWAAAVVAALVLLLLASILLFFPRSSPPLPLPSATQSQIDRGRYLFEHVLACHDCHSRRDWRFYSGPVIAVTAGGGAWIPDPVVPTWSANITPHALGSWTDGEVLRAMTAGVRRDGSAVHPLMPFDTYRNLNLNDARSVVAYLRTLSTVRANPPRPAPASLKGFLVVKVIGRLLPKPYVPPPPVPEADRVALGKYLATVAGCGGCHGTDFSGGRSVRISGTGMTAIAANLTPEPDTKIHAWSEENFVAVFRGFAPLVSEPVRGTRNTPMAWLRYAGMTDGDLRALYAYLRSLPPVRRPDRVPVAR